MEQDINVIEGRIEAILFSVGEAVERERIAKALEMDTDTVVKIIHNMMDNGVDFFIEIGPGKTLTNMIKKISADVKTVNIIEYLAEVERC